MTNKLLYFMSEILSCAHLELLECFAHLTLIWTSYNGSQCMLRTTFNLLFYIALKVIENMSAYSLNRSRFVISPYQTALLHKNLCWPYLCAETIEKACPVEKCIDLMHIPTQITAKICILWSVAESIEDCLLACACQFMRKINQFNH